MAVRSGEVVILVAYQYSTVKRKEGRKKARKDEGRLGGCYKVTLVTPATVE
jgi:hypothetical protein